MMRPPEVDKRRQDAQLIDVREPAELLTEGYIEGSIHIPMGQLQQRLDEIDKSRPVIAVCHLGHRSGRVAKFLSSHGYQADTLEGGMKAWEGAGLPVSGKAPSPWAAPQPDQASAQDEMAQTIMEVAFAVQERFGDREPTDEESRQFMTEWLVARGRTPEEAEQLLG